MSWVQDGAELIAGERERQKREEGWTADHDDEHDGGQLADAAACYTYAASIQVCRSFDEVRSKQLVEKFTFNNWPWEDAAWKPSDDPIKNLVRAGALIAAEIDRLQRKAGQ